MPSETLQRAVNSYESYIERMGVDDKVIESYLMACNTALIDEKEVSYGLGLTTKVKGYIEAYVRKLTQGATVDGLEVYCYDNSVWYQIIDHYYTLLRFEAPYRVDSFFSYIESYEKDPYKRFYFPRKKRLAKVIQAYQDVYDGKLDFLSVSQPKRTGKELDADTLITTPTGNIRIGDIKVGDYVIGKSGKPTKVIGVYPQGKKPVYEMIITESGKSKQKTTIRAGANHQWEVRTEDDRYRKKPARVMTTIELMNGTLHRGHDRHNNYSIDYVMPIEFDHKETPIDPYLFGILIGDGGFSSGSIMFSNTEEDVIAKFKRKVHEAGDEVVFSERCSYRIKGTNIKKSLIKLGLYGCRSYEKHIPNDYLYNSIPNRTLLLKGLIDTDGYVEKGTSEYSTTSKELCEQFVWLVKSLGGKAEYKERDGRYTRNGNKIETRKNYRIAFCFPNKGVLPITSDKHMKKYKQNRDVLYHFISDIRKIDEYAEMVCIEVEDKDCLYVLDDNFILTHNTTAGLKFSQQLGGRTPAGSIFATGKGESLVKRFYGGLDRSFSNPEEYRKFLDVFPESEKVGQSAEELSINLKGGNSVFSTFTCRPIDGAIVGSTEANLLVYIDDCVKNHEEARNRERLEFLCEKVTDDVLGRRIEGTPIIIQGTKYSLYDPITMLIEKAQELGWRWREVSIPALDPETDESNWEIIRDGKKIFTTEYYQKERMLVSPETWAAEFQQEPYEAKGRMFPEEKLNRFEHLPIDMEPDAIMAACDCADSGEDSVSMPIAYVYGSDVYIVDVVFDSAGTEFTIPQCASMLLKHNVKTVTFESNQGGKFFGRDVMDLLKNFGGRCSAKYKFNTANKITRMENAQMNILRDYYFLDKKMYERNSPYGMFMKELTTMTRSGRVKHDDAPDSLALLENEMRVGVATVEAAVNPFRRR